MSPEQQKCVKELSRLFEIFQSSEAVKVTFRKTLSFD